MLHAMASKFKMTIVDETFIRERCIPAGEPASSYDIERADQVEDRGDYGLVGVRIHPRNLLRNPPSPAQGVALLEDGSAYYLPDREQFLAFYMRLRGKLPPLAVARLVLEFQPEDDDVQELYLGGELPSHTFRDHPELSPPSVKSTDPLDVSFFSFRRALWQNARIYEWRVAEKDGTLDWRSDVIWGARRR